MEILYKGDKGGFKVIQEIVPHVLPKHKCWRTSKTIHLEYFSGEAFDVHAYMTKTGRITIQANKVSDETTF